MNSNAGNGLTRQKSLLLVSVIVSSSLLLSGCSIVEGLLPQSSAIEQYKKPSINSSDSLLKVESISDAHGKYTRTTIPTENLPYSGDELDAVKSAINFTMLEGLDSIALDDGSRWEEWQRDVAPKYISANSIQQVLNLKPTYGAHSASNIILQNVDNVLPLLMRDGGVRVADKRISNMNVYEANGAIGVGIEGTAVVYANEPEATSWLKKDIQSEDMYNADGTPMSPAQKEETLKKHTQGAWSAPSLEDGKPNATIIKFSVGYQMVKENNSWMISSFNNSFEVNQAMITNNAGGQMNYREKIR